MTNKAKREHWNGYARNLMRTYGRMATRLLWSFLRNSIQKMEVEYLKKQLPICVNNAWDRDLPVRLEKEGYFLTMKRIPNFLVAESAKAALCLYQLRLYSIVTPTGLKDFLFSRTISFIKTGCTFWVALLDQENGWNTMRRTILGFSISSSWFFHDHSIEAYKI